MNGASEAEMMSRMAMGITMEAAAQVFRISLNGSVFIIKAVGKPVMDFLAAAVTGEGKTAGKARLATLLRSGKPLKIYTFREDQMKDFISAAKRYGIVYSAVKRDADDKKNHVYDIMVKAEDAPKINRVFEKINYATVDADITAEESTHDGSMNLQYIHELIQKAMEPGRDTENPSLAVDDEYQYTASLNQTDRPSVVSKMEKARSVAETINSNDNVSPFAQFINQLMEEGEQENGDEGMEFVGDGGFEVVMDEGLENVTDNEYSVMFEGSEEEAINSSDNVSPFAQFINQLMEEGEQENVDEGIEFVGDGGFEVVMDEGLENVTDNEYSVMFEGSEKENRYNQLSKEIRNILGISRNTLTKSEGAYLNKWINEYGFSDELIMHASDIASTAKPNSVSFAYVNGILQNWHKSNIRTIADVDELDKAFVANNKRNSQKSSEAVVNVKGFNNFTNTKTDSDLEEMEKLLLREVNM